MPAARTPGRKERQEEITWEVIIQCRGAKTQIGLQSEAQKPWWVCQQPFGHPAKRTCLSFSSAGLSFHDLARSMSTPCIFCKVSEIQQHWGLSTCYLLNHPV